MALSGRVLASTRPDEVPELGVHALVVIKLVGKAHHACLDFAQVFWCLCLEYV